MKNRFLIYLISISMVTFFSCSNSNSSEDENSYEKISEYFNKEHNCNIDKYDKIVVVSQKGCLACNTSFAELAIDYLVDGTSLFLVTSDGTNLDISPFQKLEKSVCFDWNINSAEYEILSESKVIYLKDKDIDTIITITAKDINSQFDFIRSK